MRILAAVAVSMGLWAQEAAKPNALTAVCADAEIVEFGMECTAEEPCAIYLELSAVEPLGAKIFLAGNFHTQNTTLWSVLLASEDDGKTWAEPAARLRGASLDQIQFVDFESGWVAGHVAGTLPKDPFFLRTGDGGKTWRKLAVFEDTAYGTVEHFWFSSKTQGEMVVNRKGAASGRYQRWETLSGGEGWMMREASAAAIASPRPRTATANTADWRVRADGQSKTFRVERREAGKWVAVASFAVRAGECKPAPAAQAEKQ